MKSIIGTKKGFTLIEMLVVLILVGIIAAVAGIGLVNVVQGMVFTKMNAALVQKAQIAMTKMVKELHNINAVTTADATSITFTAYKAGIPDSHTLMLAGSTITFDGDIVTDQVSGFTLRYFDFYDGAAQTTWQSSRRIIEITLQLTGADNVVTEFKERVTGRNL